MSDRLRELVPAQTWKRYDDAVDKAHSVGAVKPLKDVEAEIGRIFINAALTEQPDATAPLEHTSPGGVVVPPHVFKHEYCPACTTPGHPARELPPVAPPAQVLSAETKLELVKPDDMIDWLNALNSNWSVCRNTRSFKEGQPSEYWKKFDKEMGYAFKLLVALMKLRSPASTSGETL